MENKTYYEKIEISSGNLPKIKESAIFIDYEGKPFLDKIDSESAIDNYKADYEYWYKLVTLPSPEPCKCEEEVVELIEINKDLLERLEIMSTLFCQSESQIKAQQDLAAEEAVLFATWKDRKGWMPSQKIEEAGKYFNTVEISLPFYTLSELYIKFKEETK